MSVEWKTALTSILEELDDQEYKKMLCCSCFDKIPKHLKTNKSREEMPQTIIQYLGVDESISAIKEAMLLIPRKDSAVQDKLRPFVNKPRIKQEEESKGKKRKHESDRNSADKEPKTKPNELKRSILEKERNNQSWRKTIRDLKSSDQLQDSEAIVGKVIQKSGPRKNDNGTVYFYVSVADDTDCIKLTVYGKHCYQEINEERSYMFRKLMKDENVWKVIKHSKVSQTSAVKVPEELEMEARKLICVESPVYSIAEIRELPEKYGVTVEGTVTEIERAPVQKARIEIQAIQSTDPTQTFLEAVYNGLMDTFAKSTQLLSNENLFNKMPFSAGPQRENLQRNLPAGGSVSAEETLRSVRAEFIDRVSKSNLDQLLDKLLDSVVINDGEMELIKTGTRADKARELIDMVRGKGSEASSHFIAAFCKLDPYLSRELKLRDD